MERIYVAVRARPLSLEEAKSSPWRISGNSIANPNYSSKFDFDRIFGEDIKTREVYEARTKDIVEAAVHGFNGTVFAYGQTNSGKTHTMRGSAAEPGVIPLSIRDLFELIQEDMDREFLLRMSYMEIYNEEINDLLAPDHGKLQIHESIERGIYVAGLKEEIVASPEQVLEFMEYGESHRHTGETNMNLYSSRSHTIFRMIIESRERSENADTSNSCDAVRVSVLNLVDLAGSERAAKTGAEGVRLKEGSHINKSLMTLGTVIKKLSEGAESQGGHVPYRDSKLTRILQPALGGNANTAIICNITLAPIHADETKSSLQFASRALRVTNCAQINEILTDAALLKRQKKEIQELKAKLQGSHSDRFEEEILNLRNTLLQTELERERIALELEEEKKAQAEKERVLQEQAKKIENLSSIVLNSNRDDNIQQHKKSKRRDTWCFTNQPRETLKELNTAVQAKDSAVKSMRSKREVGPLLPFEELVNEVAPFNLSKTVHMRNNNAAAECGLPPPPLLHVTSRKKAAGRNRRLSEESSELKELHAAYEDLLLKFETERTVSEIKVDTLSRKLAKAESCLNLSHDEEVKTARDSEAILVIKQLQEKISLLEMERCSSDKKLDCAVELAAEQNLCAMDKCDQLNKELLDAREEVKMAREQLSASELVRTDMGSFELMMKLLSDLDDLTFEAQRSRNLSESVCLVVDDYSKSFSSLSNLLSEFKALGSRNSMQLKAVIIDHEKLHNGLMHKISELKNEKQLLQNQCLVLHGQIQEQSGLVKNKEKELIELSEGRDFERSELLSYIQTLEKELSSMSSSFLSREKENLRKDLEKTRAKLKETESKLRNAIQEKTKLEGEKACSERELKKLHGQKALLQRDINKCESIADRRRDSMVDYSRGKSLAHSYEQMQEEYKRLEVIAFEMDANIVSLQSELDSANKEKDIALSKTESLAYELQALSDELNMNHSELEKLQEENSHLTLNLEELKSYNHKMEGSINLMVEEKDELAMQLTEALLAMEEEKAIWAAMEKASIEAIEAKSRTYIYEITLLSKEITEVRNQLASCREDYEVLRERLSCSEEDSKREKLHSEDKYLEDEKLIKDLRVSEHQSKRSQEDLLSKLDIVYSDHRHACEHIEMLKMELNGKKKEKEYLLNETRESNQDLSSGNTIGSAKKCEGVYYFEETNILQNQLLMVTNERDVLKSQINDHRIHQMAVESSNLSEKLLKANAEIEGLTSRLSILEVKMHGDEVVQSKETAKLRMRLRGTNAKKEAFNVRYKESVQENKLMNAKFEEASGKLKAQLSTYVQEIFSLKKQLAGVKGQ